MNSALPRPRPGFTVIELLVSLSIFAVISAVVMVNFNAGSRSSELRSAAGLLQSRIQDAEARARNGTTVCACVVGGDVATASRCTAAGTCPSGAVTPLVPLGGYGVALQTGGKDVVLFADMNGDHLRSAGEDVTVERLSASGGVEVRTILCGSPLALVFAPPQGAVWTNGSESSSACTVTLEQTLSGARRQVEYLPFSGRINDVPL